MIHSRAALVAVIAAQWLAIVGGVLVAWWMLLDGHLGHLTVGGISLALAAMGGYLCPELGRHARKIMLGRSAKPGIACMLLRLP